MDVLEDELHQEDVIVKIWVDDEKSILKKKTKEGANVIKAQQLPLVILFWEYFDKKSLIFNNIMILKYYYVEVCIKTLSKCHFHTFSSHFINHFII